MPRKPNDLKTEPLTLSTTPHVVQCLKQLVRTGFYGKNGTEARSASSPAPLSGW